MTAAVLAYHRVAACPQDPLGLSVASERFAGHLEALRRHWDAVPVAALAKAVAAGRPPDGAVAVAIDDGYVDTLAEAAPALAAAGVPATCFVCTGAIGSGRDFWWDEVERLLLGAGERPPRLAVRVDGTAREWDTTTPSRRWVAHHQLQVWLRAQRPDPIAGAVDQIRQWAGDAAPGPRFRALTETELAELARAPGIEIGAHTRRHPALAALSPADQRAEVAASRDDLAGWLGASPAGFSYPFGVRGRDWDERAVAAVAEAGFAYAVGGYGVVGAGARPLELHRLLVPDCSPAAFTDWLAARVPGGGAGGD